VPPIQKGEIILKRILVIDDEEPIRQLLKEEFEEEGYRILTAASGKEALTLLRQSEKPDLIILDLRMREMNGLELMNFYTKLNYRIPVIIFTAYGVYKNDPVLMAADAYIIKSSDITQLKDKVHELAGSVEYKEHVF
jgi:CheY-like chemotaxis protein